MLLFTSIGTVLVGIHSLFLDLGVGFASSRTRCRAFNLVLIDWKRPVDLSAQLTFALDHLDFDLAHLDSSQELTKGTLQVFGLP